MNKTVNIRVFFKVKSGLKQKRDEEMVTVKLLLSLLLSKNQKKSSCNGKHGSYIEILIFHWPVDTVTELTNYIRTQTFRPFIACWKEMDDQGSFKLTSWWQSPVVMEQRIVICIQVTGRAVSENSIHSLVSRLHIWAQVQGDVIRTINYISINDSEAPGWS